MVILVSRLRLTQITGQAVIWSPRDLKEKWLFSKKFVSCISSTLGAVESPVLIAEHTASGPRYGPNQKGGRTMAKRGSLVYQINQELQSQLRIGEKKREAKAAEHTNHPQGIFSYRTLEVYTEQCCRFARWAKESMAAARWTICDSACRNTSSVK